MQENKPYTTARYYALKALGRCAQCGRKCDRPDRTTCSKCADRAKAKYRAEVAAETPEQYKRRRMCANVKQSERRERLRAEGRCPDCGKPALPGYSTCFKHREYHRLWTQKRREKAKQEGGNG